MWRKTVKREDAKEALRLIAKVLSNPRLEPDDGNQLHKARRVLEGLAHTGKIDQRMLFRAVRVMSEILLKYVK
jgi:hypothetical protein